MDQKLKKDAGKLRYDLVPVVAKEALAKCVTLGIVKGYDEDSWKKVEKKRYDASIERHLVDYQKGIKVDEDALKYGFEIHPLEAVMINAAFLLWKELNE